MHAHAVGTPQLGARSRVYRHLTGGHTTNKCDSTLVKGFLSQRNAHLCFDIAVPDLRYFASRDAFRRLLATALARHAHRESYESGLWQSSRAARGISRMSAASPARSQDVKLRCAHCAPARPRPEPKPRKHVKQPGTQSLVWEVSHANFSHHLESAPGRCLYPLHTPAAHFLGILGN